MTPRSTGTGLICAVLIFALGYPLISDTDPVAQSLLKALQPPSQDALLGYDHLGRSMAARLAAALRLSLGIAFVTLSRPR